MATSFDSPESQPHQRIVVFDTLRGLTVVSMVVFHACYDLAYLEGVQMDWFVGTLFQTVWRASISWTFLALAGWMTCFSQNNLRRAGVYAAAALLVWVVTSVAGVDTAVSFGILFCMAASTLIVALAAPVLDRIHPVVGIALSLVFFGLTYALPQTRYPVEGLAWLGFPSPSFTSGDYYPLLPYVFMYLAGHFGAKCVERFRPEGYPRWMLRDWFSPLTAVGRWSLVIYLLHQPVLLVLTGLITGV